MKGIIDKIARIRKEGKKPFDVLTIEGQDYSNFDTKESAELAEGQMVEFDFETSGEYKNIKKIAAVTAAKKGGENDRIVRSVAIKAVAKIAGLKDWATEAPIAVARKFEKYITEG